LLLPSRLVASGTSYYVDSVAGSDGNNGLSMASPVQTITGLLALSPQSGSTIYLKRGSVFNGSNAPDVQRGLGWAMLNLSDAFLTNISVRAYGSGPEPIFDCADYMPVTGWTAYGSRTWTRSIAIGHGNIGLGTTALTGTGEEQVSVWDLNATGPETTHLRVRTSAAAVDANPGSFYYDVTNSVLYVSPYADAAPAGGQIAVAMRDTGIMLGAEADVEDIQAQRCLDNNGTISVGRSSTVRRCLILDAGRHNILIGSGLIDNCDVSGQGNDVDYGGYSALAYYFQGTGTSDIVKVTNSRISYGIAVDGSYAWEPVAGWNSLTTSHTQGGGEYASIEIDGTTAINFISVLGNQPPPPGPITLTGDTFIDIPIIVEAGGVAGTPMDVNTTGNVIVGSSKPNSQTYVNLLRADGPVVLNSKDDTIFGYPFYGIIWVHSAASGSSINVSGATDILTTDSDGDLVSVDSGTTGVPISVTGTTYGGIFGSGYPAIVLPSTNLTYTGSSNSYIAGITFLINGTYDQLGAFQTAFNTDLNATVLPAQSAPIIVGQPQSQSLGAGSTATFSVVPDGNPIPSFQWYKNGSAIPGATFPVLTLPDIQAGDAATYTVSVTSSQGTVTSAPASLSLVSYTAPTILSQPASTSVPYGSSAQFTVSASSATPMTYQWQREPAGSSNWTTLSDGGGYSGSATATLTVGPASIAMSGDQFRCQVTDSYDTATSNAATLAVTPASQAITFGSLGSVTYAPGTTLALGASASSGLPVAYASSNTAVATVSGATVSIVGGGSTLITANQSGDSDYQAAPGVSQTLTVNPAPQSLSFGPLSAVAYTPGLTIALTATASSGLPVTYSSSDTAVATVSGSMVTIVGGGSTTITASQAGSADYQPAAGATQALTVNPAPQTITFGSLNAVTYGSSPVTLEASTNSGLPVAYTSSNTAVATVSGSTITIVGGGSTTITATQPGNSDYQVASEVSQTLTVSPAAQNISFGALSPVGFSPGLTITLTATATSGLPLAYTSSNTAVATVSGSTVTILGAGATTITANQPGNANYQAAASVAQVLTVDPGSQTITFNPLSPVSYSQGLTLTLDASASSGLPVSYTSSNPAVATVSGTTATILSQGTTTITASQAGSADYLAAANASQMLTVNPSPPEVTNLPAGTATRGQPFYLAIAANNSPQSFGAKGLPSGLQVNGATGVISGTPAVAGTFAVTLSATNLGGTGTASWSLTVLSPGTSMAFQIATLAGKGTPGSTDGAGGLAEFRGPSGLAVDSSGDVYVADSGNDTIREISPAGVVTTLAGSPGSPGSADGSGTAARFNDPTGVAVDSSGDVYVADSGNDTIRVISPVGVVTTLAGSPGSPGSANGSGSAARFSDPTGVAVDSSGDVYVADSGNDTIRVISPAGVVTTLAGSPVSPGSANGAGTAARFNDPTGVAVDSSGDVYVADSGNDTIRVISPAGVVTTLAGSPGSPGSANGTGSKAQFSGPTAVAVDASGNVYVADTGNNLIREIQPGGVVTTVAPSTSQPAAVLSGSSVSADAAGGGAFDGPLGVTVDASGNVYVGDSGDNEIQMAIALPVVTSSLAATDPVGKAFSYQITASNDPTSYSATGLPPGLALNPSTGAITGTPTASGTYTVEVSGMNQVEGVAADLILTVSAPSQTTYTPFDFSTYAGQLAAGGANGTGSSAQFSGPAAVAVDSNGNVYVADSGNDTIRKISPGGIVTTLAGTAGSPGSTDGTGASARFNDPTGVAVDSSGNIYVADSGNDTIREITPAGVVTTLAGTAGSSGSADGTGASARFDDPYGVAVDSSGEVYVSDSGNDTIRKIAPGGGVTTLAGAAGNFGSANGSGSSAQFFGPEGLAVDSSGNVYVADDLNEMVRKVAPTGVVTTLAGTAGTPGTADGAESASLFDSPSGVAVDALGNVYVADFENETIREISSVGAVTTLGGSPGYPGSANGAGGSAEFYDPAGIAVTTGGELYVADAGNNEIRQGMIPAPTITTEPQSASAPVGGSFTLAVGATGTGAIRYQWYQNGTAIAGQTAATMAKSNAQAGDSGSYTVVVSNSGGSVTSSAATVTVAQGAASSGGGGGGAPSVWFDVALALAVAMRALTRYSRKTGEPVS
jgi:sugar lactone lactonase YvrE